jgi:hypothetical protein
MGAAERTAEERARAILTDAGIVIDRPLRRVEGNWSNEVWIGTDHVLRISSRQPAWLEHELNVASVLPTDLPYPRPIASGWDGPDLWVIAPRIRAEPLYAAWAQAESEEQRDQLMAALATSLRRLHHVELPPELAHPPSIGGGPPVIPAEFPDRIRAFLNDVIERGVVPADVGRNILGLVDRYEEQLSGGAFGAVHTDMTFANALWDGDQMWVIDLEYCCWAPIDYEVMWILRYCWLPNSLPSEWVDRVASSDHSGAPALLLKHYPELFEHPGIRARLTLYGLASYARGWVIRPDMWTDPTLRPSSVASLTEFISDGAWLKLLPAG